MEEEKNSMYDREIVLQLIFLFFVFVLIHLLLKYDLAERCNLKPKNQKPEEQKRVDRIAKRRLFWYPILITTSVTVFSLFFFCLTVKSLYQIIEINSIALSITGTAFIAFPTLIRFPTYWEKTHKTGNVRENLLFKDIPSYLHTTTGFLFIFYGFLIRLALILQQ